MGKNSNPFRKRNRDLEHMEQIQVVEWVRFQIADGKHVEELELFHSSPNGGKRDPRTAVKLKNEGTLSGIPDLFLPVKRGVYSGLYIEMKQAEGGRISPNQAKVQAGLRKQGFMVVNCWTAVSAIDCLQTYLKMEPFSLGVDFVLNQRRVEDAQ